MKNKLSVFIPRIAFIFAVLCSTAYLLMLGYYSTLLLDDYGYTHLALTEGVGALVRTTYLGAQCRFAGFFVTGILMNIFGHDTNMIGYTLFMLLAGYGSLYALLVNIFRQSKKIVLWGFAMLLINVAIMACLEISTFFWLCCSIYFLEMYATLLLVTILFYSQRPLWYRYIIMVLMSAYIGGAAENYTPIVILCMGLIFIVQIARSKELRFYKNPDLLLLFVSIVIMTAGFVAMLLGPGTRHRMAMTQCDDASFMLHFSLWGFLKTSLMATVIFGKRIVARIGYYFLVFPIAIWLGNLLRSQGGLNRLFSWKKVVSAVLALFLAVALPVAVTVFGMGWYTSFRAYCFVSFAIMAVFVYAGVVIGTMCDSKHGIWGSTICSLLIAGLCVAFCTVEQPIAKDYHRQIVTCQNAIKEHIVRGDSTMLIVPEVHQVPLPNSYSVMYGMIRKAMGKEVDWLAKGTYFPYENFTLTIYPSNWRNRGIQHYYGADFDIKGWVENNE